jgi:hypothetical protein
MPSLSICSRTLVAVDSTELVNIVNAVPIGRY